MAMKKIKSQVRKIENTVKIRGWTPFVLSFAGAVVFIGLAAWAFQQVLATRAVTRAKEDLHNGFASLAADRLEPYRHELASSDEGCRVMLQAFEGAHHADHALWAGEACASAGHAVPQAYLSMARTYEHQNDVAAATSAYVQATHYAPTNEAIVAAALKFFATTKNWNAARPVAEAFGMPATQDAETYLLVGQALKNGGDPAAARPLVEQARTLLTAQAEDEQTRLKTAYREVLDDREPASTPARHYRRYRRRRH